MPDTEPETTTEDGSAESSVTTKQSDGSYNVELVETDYGATFVQIYDHEVSQEDAVSFLPVRDAVNMANTILDAVEEAAGDDDE